MSSPAEKLADINRAIATCMSLGFSTAELEQARDRVVPEYELDCRIAKAVPSYLLEHLAADAVRGAVVREALKAEGLELTASTPGVPCARALIEHYGENGEHPQFPSGVWRESVASGLTRQGYWAWVENHLAGIADVEAGR